MDLLHSSQSDERMKTVGNGPFLASYDFCSFLYDIYSLDGKFIGAISGDEIVAMKTCDAFEVARAASMNGFSSPPEDKFDVSKCKPLESMLAE